VSCDGLFSMVLREKCGTKEEQEVPVGLLEATGRLLVPYSRRRAISLIDTA
jgi:hypothetical protein